MAAHKWIVFFTFLVLFTAQCYATCKEEIIEDLTNIISALENCDCSTTTQPPVSTESPQAPAPAEACEDDPGYADACPEYAAVEGYCKDQEDFMRKNCAKSCNFCEGEESPQAPALAACNFDFENGIDSWGKTGTVFNNQPTFGDNPTARHREQPANQQGDWWIGGAEDRPSKATTAGAFQGDRPTGTLTSPRFRISGQTISFLIGGGCDVKLVRAELIVNDQVVRKATGYCKETMSHKKWDVKDLIGQHARVRLVDNSSGVWGHINFDDLKGDIICE